MSDRDAFLAAIRAAPNDDLPRLVYADWLEETGEHDTAIFIRYQLTRPPWPLYDRDESSRLQLAAYPLAWVDPEHLYVGFRRGLVDQVVSTVDALPTWARGHPVTLVDVLGKVPQHTAGTWYWNFSEYTAGEAASVPKHLMPKGSPGHYCGHPSHRAAVDALNAQVLRWLRT